MKSILPQLRGGLIGRFLAAVGAALGAALAARMRRESSATSGRAERRRAMRVSGSGEPRGLHVRSNWKYHDRYTHILSNVVTEANARRLAQQAAKKMARQMREMGYQS